MGMYSKSAEELLMLTAAVETNLGEYIKQINGPARGIFQVEPLTYNDIMYRWLPSASDDMRNKVEAFEKAFVGMCNADTMVYNLKYAIIVTRLFYYRVPKPLPAHDDVHGLATYWKNHYNTKAGKGTVAKAVEKYKKFVKPAEAT